ncbi:unnamed protein product [Psylliodes chrysocephalus]|uniref:Uncharacterized protein n=1 Tax=Psylliodes chrysocephalus TaxID=3402493 RepID=A0A9P0GKH9_9CUCU|nr:unnamed protein product [Psylliodes chrysocephala]
MKLLKFFNYSQPEDLIKSLCYDNKMEESCLEKRCDNCIKKTCKKNIKKDVICNKEKMMEALQRDLPKCMQHIANIRHQYQFINTLKDLLEKEDVFVHMDFSENYQCKYNREIQSALSENTRHDHIGIFAHLQPLFQQISEKLITNNKKFSKGGHGKGAPDDIGGVIKRTADRLVALGEDIPDHKCLVEQVSNRCSGIQLQVVTKDF